MLPDDILYDLYANCHESLLTSSACGLNGRMFHSATPDLPFGADEVRQAATYIRSRSVAATAVELSFHGVTDYLLLVARSDELLTAMVDEMRAGLTNGVLTVLSQH